MTSDQLAVLAVTCLSCVTLAHYFSRELIMATKQRTSVEVYFLIFLICFAVRVKKVKSTINNKDPILLHCILLTTTLMVMLMTLLTLTLMTLMLMML